MFLAQSGRPFGTAAEYVAVPSGHAVVLPRRVPLEQGADAHEAAEQTGATGRIVIDL